MNIPILVNSMNNTIIVFAITVRVLNLRENNRRRVSVILMRDGLISLRSLRCFRAFTMDNLIHNSPIGVDDA